MARGTLVTLRSRATYNVQPFARVASDASNGSDHHLEYNRIIGYENALCVESSRRV